MAQRKTTSRSRVIRPADPFLRYITMPLLHALIALPLALLLGWLSLRETRVMEALEQRGLRAEGTVVAHERRSSTGYRGRRRRYTVAIVEFADASGNGHRFSLPQSLRPPVGSTVTVVYLEEKPNTNLITDDFTRAWVAVYLGYILTILSAVAFVFSCVRMIKAGTPLYMPDAPPPRRKLDMRPGRPNNAPIHPHRRKSPGGSP